VEFGTLRRRESAHSNGLRLRIRTALSPGPGVDRVNTAGLPYRAEIAWNAGYCTETQVRARGRKVESSLRVSRRQGSDPERWRGSCLSERAAFVHHGRIIMPDNMVVTRWNRRGASIRLELPTSGEERDLERYLRHVVPHVGLVERRREKDEDRRRGSFSTAPTLSMVTERSASVGWPTLEALFGCGRD
jgi:hypothetical protein